MRYQTRLGHSVHGNVSLAYVVSYSYRMWYRILIVCGIVYLSDVVAYTYRMWSRMLSAWLVPRAHPSSGVGQVVYSVGKHDFLKSEIRQAAAMHKTKRKSNRKKNGKCKKCLRRKAEIVQFTSSWPMFAYEVRSRWRQSFHRHSASIWVQRAGRFIVQ